MAETAKPATVGKSPYEEVVVHPLVLLSVVDHFRRVEEVRVPRANGAKPPHRAARHRWASIACHARTLHPDVHQIQLTSPFSFAEYRMTPRTSAWSACSWASTARDAWT